MVYNSLVNVTQKRYKEMTKTKRYRNILLSLTGDKKKDKSTWKKISCIRIEFDMSEYSFYNDVKNMQHHFKRNIDSLTARTVASALWKSYKKLFFGNGHNVHFKRYGELNSLGGKSNKMGIRFIGGDLIWNGLKIPVKTDYNNQYEYEALQSEICYCRN